jgi:hypothetical protein
MSHCTSWAQSSMPRKAFDLIPRVNQRLKMVASPDNSLNRSPR